MNLPSNISQSVPPLVVKAIVVVLGILAIYVGIKIADFVFKIVCVLLGLALIGWLVWWEFLR